MLKSSRLRTLLFVIAAVFAGAWPASAFAATDPGLGGAGHFAVLAGSTVTNTGPSWITGQLGVAPGTAVTGFPPGVSGVQHKGDSVATTAQTNLTAAYTNAKNQQCPGTNNFSNVNLGGKKLVPGVYCQTTAPTLTGTLTLNGSGIYIFQIGSTLVTASGARVVLIGGAQPCQIFWQVSSSATIATSTTFVGTIMALTSIAMQTRATLNGRALARNGAVTLDTNRIIQPAGCGFTAPTSVAAPAGNVLPATLAPTSTSTSSSTTSGVGFPNTGVPPQQPGSPWWPLAAGGVVITFAALLALRMRTRRRDS